MNRDELDQLLTLQEAADKLHIHYDTVRRRTRNKVWPSVHIGRAVRMRASVIAAIENGELDGNERNGDES